MPKDRLLALATEASKVRVLLGDVAELGVYRGGSTLLLAAVLRNKIVHAFESFEGLIDLSANHDRLRQTASDRGHLPGDFSIAGSKKIEKIEKRLERAGILFYRGRFAARKDEIASRSFCLAHFDADTYFTAKEFLEFFYPRLVHGGRIILDDYGWKATPGVERAVADFNAKLNIPIYALAPFQAMIIKE